MTKIEVLKKMVEAAESFKALGFCVDDVTEDLALYYIQGRLGTHPSRSSFEIRVRMGAEGGGLWLVLDTKVQVEWPATSILSPTKAVREAKLHREMAEAACVADVIIGSIAKVIVTPQ